MFSASCMRNVLGRVTHCFALPKQWVTRPNDYSGM